jgi:hypothetical protein
MPNDQEEVNEVVHKALRGQMSDRDMAMIGYSTQTKRAINRAISLNPALEKAILNIADLAYADGAVQNDDEPPRPLRPEPKPDICRICHNVHTAKQIMNLGVERGSLIPGHEYVIITKTTGQRYQRKWRMGFLGAYGMQLQFSARGPDRTHARQYGGTETLDGSTIISIQEVERNDSKRHVGAAIR